MDGWNHKWTELPEGKGRIDLIQFLNKNKIDSSSRIGKKGIISRGANDPNWPLDIAKCDYLGANDPNWPLHIAKINKCYNNISCFDWIN